jgi:predicted metal-dependent hydrolase
MPHIWRELTMSNNNTNSSPLDKTFEYNKRKLKPTDYVRSWIEEKVSEYVHQIGIMPQEIPKVVFSRKEVLAMPKELTAGRRSVTHKYLGVCFRKARTILINVKKHASYAALKHTIIHELVHYRFRYLKHGKGFEDRISQVLRGKRYKLKVLYPEILHYLPLIIKITKTRYNIFFIIVNDLIAGIC